MSAIARLVAAAVLLATGADATAAPAAAPGSIATELGLTIGPDGRVQASAAFSGRTGVGIPLPAFTVGIAPGEPVVLSNLDLNAVAIAGGVIAEATNGAINTDLARRVINTGLSGGNVADVISVEAAKLIAIGLDDASGGFIPQGISRRLISAAVRGDDVEDVLVGVVFELVLAEARRLLAGEVGTAVQQASSGIITPDDLQLIFDNARNGQNLGDLLTERGLAILTRRFGQRLADLTAGAVSARRVQLLLERALAGQDLQQVIADATTDATIALVGAQLQVLSGGALTAGDVDRLIRTVINRGNARDLLSADPTQGVIQQLSITIAEASGGRIAGTQVQQAFNAAVNGGFNERVRTAAVDAVAASAGPNVIAAADGLVTQAQIRAVLDTLIRF